MLMIDYETITESPGVNCSGVAGRLASILVITKKMLLEARNGSWDQVTEMEMQRALVLRECFSSPIPEQHSDTFTDALAAMLHMNEELIALLENAKAEVAIKRTDQARTSKSLGHYLDIESTH